MLTESLESFIQLSPLGSDMSRDRVWGGDKLEWAELESPPTQTRGFCLLRVKNMASYQLHGSWRLNLRRSKEMDASIGVCNFVRAETTENSKVRHLFLSSIQINGKCWPRAVPCQHNTGKARGCWGPAYKEEGHGTGKVPFKQQKKDRTGKSTEAVLRGLLGWVPHPRS